MDGRWQPRAILAVSAAVATVGAAVLCWDRLVHDMTSSPQPGEALISSGAWAAVLLAIAAVPLVLSLRHARSGMAPRWPRAEPFVLAGAVIYFVGALAWYWPRWPELLNSDLEVASVTFIVAAVVFASALFKAVVAVRARRASHAVANLSVSAASWSIAFVVSWLMLHFE